MINRRNIRSKVMQEIYAMERAGEQDLEKSAKRLAKNLENIYGLYLSLLDLLVELKRTEAELIEKRKHKFFKTEEDLHPNTKFIDNIVLNKLEKNEMLKELLKKYRIEHIWKNEREIVRFLLDKIKRSKIYRKYMDNPGRSFGEDKQFVLDVYKNLIAPEEKLHKVFEDKEINWADDVAIANTMVMKTLDEIREDDTPYKPVPPLYKQEDDRRFSKELLFRTWQNREELGKYIKERVINWDYDRISNIDRILMMLALAEMLYFPNIPPRVSINEYVEIAKEFSQPQSNVFINGILDRVYKDLQAENRIQKTSTDKT